jgi:valyl-tRNA synthetase
VIEPYLTDQWFVKMDSLGARGLELVENGSVRFVPENWVSTYRHWMGNIQDWCISRQLWWGHRIPAWYDAEGGIHVGRSELEIRDKKGLGNDVVLTRDNDVLETWFSSSLWSHSTLGWPDEREMAKFGYERYLPTSVLVTGFDIIFFWVARMIMMTDHFTGQVPFKDVYITGLVRDSHGQKMSKSKGNVLDPIDIIDGISLDALIRKRTTGLMKPTDAPKIEKATSKEFPEGIPAFGADALRFTFASLATHGRDIKFDLNRAEGYKNFCNKLWNAARFVLMNCEGFTVGAASAAMLSGESGVVIAAEAAPTPKTDAERWILARLVRTAQEVETQLAAYRFDLAAQAMYDFTWNEYCDWFLELAKPALHGNDAEAADSTRHTLLYVLERLLRLLHPLIPFITEEIWQAVAPRLGIVGASISTQSYPEGAEIDPTAASAEADIEWLKLIVSQLRRIRSELNLPPAKAISLLLDNGRDSDRARIEKFDSQLRFLAKVDSIAWLDPTSASSSACATGVVGELKLLVPLEGLVDLSAEKARLEKEIKRIQSEIAKCQGKLASETFVNNAPAAVVEQERQRLVDWTNQLGALSDQTQRM